MNLAMLNASGKEEQITVSAQAFDRPYNEPLVQQVIVAQMAGMRAGTKAQKTRADRNGGGRKPWRQKGTGRARSGSIRSPIWRGGGVTFAARPKDHSQKVNKKMYQGAMSAVLSELVRQSRLKLHETFALEQPKTKDLVQLLKSMDVKDVLIVTEFLDENIYLAARNVPRVTVIDASSLTPLDCVRHETVLMTVSALKKIEEVLV